MITNSEIRKIMKKIVVGIGAVIVVAGVLLSALYAQTWNPIWNPFRPEAEEVISEMSEKMKTLDSFHSDYLIKARIKEKGDSLVLRIRSDIDQKDEENLKGYSDIDITLSYKAHSYPFLLEAISIGKEQSYLKIKRLPDISALLSLFPEAQQETLLFSLLFSSIKDEIQGKWIKVDEESIKELYKEIGVAYLEQELGGLSEFQQKEMEEKLIQLLEDKKLYYVDEELPDEKIGNVKVYHYRLVIDKEGLKSLIPDFLEIVIDYSSSSFREQGISSEEVKKIIEEVDLPLLIDKLFEKVGNIEYELWIGQKDKYLYRIEFSKEINLEKFKEVMVEYAQEIALEKGKETISRENIQELERILQGTLLISMRIDFSNFNKVENIQPPDDFLTIKEVMQNIFERFFNTMMRQGVQGITPKMDIPI